MIRYFVLTFIFSWFFWLLGILDSQNILTLPVPSMVYQVLGAFGPFFGAFVMTLRTEGWAGVKRLFGAGFKLRMPLVWWLSILFIPLALNGLAVWLNMRINAYQMDMTLLNQPLMILPTFLIMFFIGGSFQEEFGWRGYALPRLLERWNPLISSLILGAIWGVWHLPLFFIAGTGQFYMNFGVFWLLAVGFSVFFTWIYLATGRNLFSALLLHTAINTSMSIFPPIVKAAGGNQTALTYLMIAYLVVTVFIVISNRDLMLNRK